MDGIPTSMVAAMACSAAAGKNPWFPLGLIFLLAAPDEPVPLLMDADLHRQLQALGPSELCYGLAALFLVLSLADSFADKVSFVERWLVPISTAWRPFAGVACAALIGGSAALEHEAVAAAEQVVRADLLIGGSLLGLTVMAGALTGWLATMGKTGARLLIGLVPVPGLRFAHSLLDDLFAIGATLIGLALAASPLAWVLVGLYLLVGLALGPLLTRLTWIHVRIGLSLIGKARRAMSEERGSPTPRPRWLERWLRSEGLDPANVVTAPAYVFRAPVVGRCRVGFLVSSPLGVAFVSRIHFRPRAFRVAPESLARLGLADTTTARVVSVAERLERGALREARLYLFPALEAEVFELLDESTSRAGLVRVRASSPSARRGLPGYSDRERSTRFLPPERAGSLRLQGLLTIAGAIIGGVLTGGIFIPIGLGYLTSPFKTRSLLGVALSAYLALSAIASFGFGLPATILYASMLNLLALRDLTRNALKAHVDGFVDRRAWLPLTAARVWVSGDAIGSDADRYQPDDEDPLTDGTWRAVSRLLADVPPDEPLTEAAVGP